MSNPGTIRIHMSAATNYNPHYDFKTGWSACKNCVHSFELIYDDNTGEVRIFLDGKDKPSGQIVFDRQKLKFDAVNQEQKEVRLMIAHRNWGKPNIGEIGMINFEPLFE